MKNILKKFCGLFPTIVFDIEEKPLKAKLSTDTVSAGERQILKMLSDAKRNLSKFKKLHKQGKASIEDVFDCDWRVHELELELMKFQDSTSTDDEY